MRAGKLRHQVRIEQKTVTQDSFGEPDATWTPYARAWAEVKPMRGREFHEAAIHGNEITTKIVIRYLRGIVPEMRVIYVARDNVTHTYNIHSVIEVDSKGRTLELMCVEVV